MATATIDPALTDAEIAHFWEQGYVVVRGALSRDEAEHYRKLIVDLMPRSLDIPESWQVADCRIKPRMPSGSHTFDSPQFIPLFTNRRLYAAAAQLLESPKLRAMDGSIGITLRNDAHRDKRLHQTLHIDASVPKDVDNFLFTLPEVQVGGCYYFTDVLPKGGGIHVVPGGHRIVEEEARADPKGRQLHNAWTHITHLESVEITGEAGDFALLHHLMPHGASYNRQSTTRVAQFLRYVREDQPHGAAKPVEPGQYDEAQLAAMGDFGRKLFGVDPW